MGSFFQSLCQSVVSFINGFFFLAYQFLLLQFCYLVSLCDGFLFMFFLKSFKFSVQREDTVTEKNEGEKSIFLEEKSLPFSEIEAEEDVAESRGFDSVIQDEKKEEILRFKFPGFEEFIRINERTVDSIDSTSGKSSIDEFEASPVKESSFIEVIEFAEHSEKSEQTFLHDDESDSDLSNFEHFSPSINISVDSYRDFVVESNNEQDLDIVRPTEQNLPNPNDLISSDDPGFGNQEISESSSLWEHEDLIEQLKMELRKVRVIGLPTILEESESPKRVDDLIPWKMEKKFQRQDLMGELHKIYTSYRERMRKLDILNYQTVYSTGFLKPKEPIQPLLKKKSSTPILKSLVSQNNWLSKHKSQEINRMHCEFEVIYVGQMCLSWEILHWQYEKVLDLWDADPRGIFPYNEVAGEFQQFQVLVQRFIEVEQFEGPRVQYYTKTRCVLRNLLQVPVVRVDKRRDKNLKGWKRDRDELIFTIDLLVEIVQESIRIFWQFLKADRDCNTTPISSHKKLPELSNPEDLKLFQLVQKHLQKKERKLKEMLRSGNCVLKRFQQWKDREEDDWDQVLSFFCQVDMKLVCRVLKMSKITREQLLWCHEKLEKISFINRKISVEPSFLLFPP